MIKKLLLLMCVHILCAQNFAESSAESNADSAIKSQDSALFAESSQNSNLDSADSANPPPHSQSITKRRI